MQVKKFEARSMKEALEMVKTQLGPDAIILSAKEITKGFGLGGEKSIEITAAYSEVNLQKKKFAESKLPDATREKYLRTSAKQQKVVTDKIIESHIARINSQMGQQANQASQQQRPQKAEYTRAAARPTTTPRPSEKRYIDIDNDQSHQVVDTYTQLNAKTPVTQTAQKQWNEMEVSVLKNEIESLRSLVHQFKPVPQNFVHGHPGAELGVHYEYTPFYQKLVAKGLLPEIAGEIVTQAQKQIDLKHVENRGLIENWIGKFILDTTPVVQDSNEQFHLFIGPTGSGKSSSLIKLASDLILNHRKRVAIISADYMKVGASEQMKIFSQILNVPFLLLRSQQDWGHIIPHLDQIDHILVDFAGLNMRTQEEFNYLKRMSPPVFNSLRTHLVLSSMIKDGDLLDLASRFDRFGFDDVIFTDLDKANVHGNIYNFVRKIRTKLFAFGIGPQVPEDFERATAERVVDLILEISKGANKDYSHNSHM